jgi:hypothetical protein
LQTKSFVDKVLFDVKVNGFDVTKRDDAGCHTRHIYGKAVRFSVI